MLFLAGFLKHLQKGFLSIFLYVLSSMYQQEVRQREKTLISNVIPEQVQDASLLQIYCHVIIQVDIFGTLSDYFSLLRDLKELRNHLHFSSLARVRASFFDRSALDLQVSNHLHGWNKLRKEGNDVSSIYKQSFIRHAILSGISHHFLMNHRQLSFLIF